MARYADQLLADGERVILRTRQHWLATIATGRTPWAILIASLLLLALNLSIEAGVLRTLIGYLGLGLFLLALVWLAIVYWSWYVQDYMVTSRRVLKVDGILRKRSADSSLEKINDAILEQSVLGRIFNYGDLEIMTAAETPVDHYDFLAGAQLFKRTMLDAKHALEQEVYDFPGPPLRAAPGPAAQAPARAPAAATPAPGNAPAAPSGAPRLTSDEITRALGNLADLRDRGAINPEDYEAKKQDLLGRL
ncbi:MAG TPA: PH domain-containing protein [Candidatus Limnocylindrales bacterium]|nr:PH domain-containing protein [Candidatus Limnocylindrales bacterium]